MSAVNLIRPLAELALNVKVREVAVDSGKTAGSSAVDHAADRLLADHRNGLPSAKPSVPMRRSSAMAPQNGRLSSLMGERPDHRMTWPRMQQGERFERGRTGALNRNAPRPLHDDGLLTPADSLEDLLQARHTSHVRGVFEPNGVTPQQLAFHAAFWGPQASFGPLVPSKIPLEQTARHAAANAAVGWAGPVVPPKIPLASVPRDPAASVAGAAVRSAGPAVPPKIPLYSVELDGVAVGSARALSQARHASHVRGVPERNGSTPQQSDFHAAFWGQRAPVGPQLPPKIPLYSAELDGVAVGSAQPATTEHRPIYMNRSTTETSASPLPVTGRKTVAARSWAAATKPIRNHLSDIWAEAFIGRLRRGNRGFGSAPGSG